MHFLIGSVVSKTRFRVLRPIKAPTVRKHVLGRHDRKRLKNNRGAITTISYHMQQSQLSATICSWLMNAASSSRTNITEKNHPLKEKQINAKTQKPKSPQTQKPTDKSPHPHIHSTYMLLLFYSDLLNSP